MNLSGCGSKIRVLRRLLIENRWVSQLLRVIIHVVRSVLKHKVGTLISVVVDGSGVWLSSIISKVGRQLFVLTLFDNLRILHFHGLHLLVGLDTLQTTHDAEVVSLENRQLYRVEIFEVLTLILNWVTNVNLYVLQRLIGAFQLGRRLRSVKQDVVDFLLHLKLGVFPVAALLRMI